MRVNSPFLQISMNGTTQSGGVERVAFYVSGVLPNSQILTANDIGLLRWLKRTFPKVASRIGWIVFAVIASILAAKSRRRVISHGFQAPFVKADVIFAHGTMAGFLATTATVKRARLGFLYRFFERNAFQRARRILAVSQKVRNELISFYGIDPNTIVVLNNCVDSMRFRPGSQMPTSGPVQILFVGRLEPAKGLATLFEVAKAVETSDGFFLTIISAGKTNLELFSGLKKTHISSDLNIDSMSEIYRRVDVLFVPSLYEGFEMITLEALSSGLAIVGNAVGALAELATTPAKDNYRTTESTEMRWPIVLLKENCETSQILQSFSAVCNRSFSVRQSLNEKVANTFSLAAYSEQLKKNISAHW